MRTLKRSLAAAGVVGVVLAGGAAPALAATPPVFNGCSNEISFVPAGSAITVSYADCFGDFGNNLPDVEAWDGSGSITPPFTYDATGHVTTLDLAHPFISPYVWVDAGKGGGFVWDDAFQIFAFECGADAPAIMAGLDAFYTTDPSDPETGYTRFYDGLPAESRTNYCDPSGGMPDTIQEVGVPASGDCADVARPDLDWAGVGSTGWSKSWASWINDGQGGSVCQRTLTFAGGRWHTAG